MTLLETIRKIEDLAKQQPNINGIVETGDIYDLSKDEFQQKYTAFCVTQRIHTITDEFATYRFTLYYVDRLTLDKSNKLEIQSSGCEFFANLIHTIKGIPELEFEQGDVQTFTERFSAECAGAYMDCEITTTPLSICAY